MFFQPTLLNDDTFDIRMYKMNDFPLHWHSDLEILCCREGSFSMWVRKTKYTSYKDDIILIGSCEPHQVCECSLDAKAVTIRVGSLFCGSAAFREIVKNRFEKPLLEKDIDAINEVEQIVSRLSHEKSYKAGIELRGHLCLLLAILLEKLPTTTQMSDNYQKRLAVTMRIQKALDLVAMRYNEDVALADVAAVSGYEKSAFCRMFRNATGSTFHRYLNEYRIKKAVVLLDDNHYSISEISNMVGFSQQKNFSRIFKDITGVTPSEYRKKHPSES